MKKKLLTSLISVISCAVTGVMWAYFIMNAGGNITKNYLMHCDVSERFFIIIAFLIVSTFLAVNVCYCAAEKIGMKAGLSRKDFFIWFCVIPLVFSYGAGLFCESRLGVLRKFSEIEILVSFSSVFFYKKIAYIMIFIFCVIRLGIKRLAALFRKTDTVSERNDISDVYNSKS